jgi:hypothetical protein
MAIDAEEYFVSANRNAVRSESEQSMAQIVGKSPLGGFYNGQGYRSRVPQSAVISQ